MRLPAAIFVIIAIRAPLLRTLPGLLRSIHMLGRFALGRLEADRGRQGEATRWLEQYLARYPRGINADDARALLRRMQ